MACTTTPPGPISTYSIVARCDETGEVGAAVASAVPAGGGICRYMRPSIGAVSTQSWVNPYLAGTILDAIASGAETGAAMAAAVSADAASAVRQVGAIGLTGPGKSHHHRGPVGRTSYACP